MNINSTFGRGNYKLRKNNINCSKLNLTDFFVLWSIENPPPAVTAPLTLIYPHPESMGEVSVGKEVLSFVQSGFQRSQNPGL